MSTDAIHGHHSDVSALLPYAAVPGGWASYLLGMPGSMWLAILSTVGPLAISVVQILRNDHERMRRLREIEARAIKAEAEVLVLKAVLLREPPRIVAAPPPSPEPRP